MASTPSGSNSSHVQDRAHIVWTSNLALKQRLTKEGTTVVDQTDSSGFQAPSSASFHQDGSRSREESSAREIKQQGDDRDDHSDEEDLDSEEASTPRVSQGSVL